MEDAENLRPGQALDSAPPGHFVSPELEADTARFLAEMKTRIRLRTQAEPRSLEPVAPR